MAYDFSGGDTTGFTNEHFTSFPPHSSFERDRLRLQRELDRDLDHPSFSSSSASGLENAGRPFNYEDDTNTFDIDNDARATSTRKVNFNNNMLQSSPVVNSRILATEFEDFSMAGNDYTAGSIEIGRAQAKNLSSQDYATKIPFPLRGATARSAAKKLSEAYATAGRDMASPAPRLSRQNSIRTDTSDLLPLNKNVLPMSTKYSREQAKRAMEDDTFDLSKAALKRPSQNTRQASDASNGSKPQKTTEQVSSRTGLRNSNARSMHVDDDVSSVASVDDIVPQKTRKVSKAVTNALAGTRGPNLRASMKAAETRESASARRKASTHAAAAAVSEVPKTFKSTAAFIKELGLDGHTAPLNNPQDPPTYDETIDLTNYNTNEQSFLLPNLAGISELINTEATRIYHNTASTRRRNPHGQPPSHKPLESIPVPQDNRAILMAMQLLQDKMASLEEAKSLTERRCEELKEQLRRIREKYETEYRRARVAEEELERRQKSGVPTLGNSEDTEAFRDKIEDKERSKIAFLVEKMKLENIITSHKTQIDELAHRFEITKIALKNMQDERNSAVNSAAAAIASQRHVQEENERLREELDMFRAEKLQYDEKMSSEREAWKAKEQILRKRVDKARDGEAVAREAIQELQKKLSQLERGYPRSEQEDVAEMVKRELERLKPELVSQSAAPLPQKTSMKRKSPSTFMTTHSAPATVTITVPLPQDTLPQESTASAFTKSTKKPSQKPSGEQVKNRSTKSFQDANETAYTVDVNYIRRIADEIEEERRRRKDAEKQAAATSAEMERIREIMGSHLASANQRKSTAIGKGKRYPEPAASGYEDNTTTQRIPIRPLSAPPTSTISPTIQVNAVSELEVPAQRVSEAFIAVSKPSKKRRIKKVVYYEEGDTTEVFSPSKDRIVTIEQPPTVIRTRAPARNAAASSSGPAKSHSDDLEATFHTAQKLSSDNSRKQTSTASDFGRKDGASLPPPPILPDHIKSVIDAEAEHNPLTCTVCIRREMQAMQDDSPRAQSNGLDASTLRPSGPAGKQLGKVVRSLQDEFVHLKMAYQEKAEEFLSLDPTKGKRRRKEITREINEMVAEMDWKCDMIYALYDVAEEVISIGGHIKHKHPRARSGDDIIGRAPAPPQGVNFRNMNVIDSEAEEEFERDLRRELGRAHDGNHDETFSTTRGVGNHNEVSLLDGSEDDTSMQVARHLAMQQKEMERQLGGGGGRQQEKVVVDSYDEGDESYRV